MEILVDPDGRVWNPYSAQFVNYLGYFGEANLALYAIRNLGFAGIVTFPKYTRILIRPSLLPRAGLERLIELLLYHDPPRIVIERIGLLRTPLEVINNLDDAFARLRILQAATPEDDDTPNAIRLALPRLSSPKRTGLREALKAWKSAHGYVQTQNIQQLADNPIFGGGALARVSDSDRCLIEAWPKTYSIYDESQYERYHGWDVRDLPDSQYLEPTIRSYFTAAHQQAPYLELIEAVLTLDNGSKYWARYERLLLPWRTRSSDCFVSSVPMLRLIRRC